MKIKLMWIIMHKIIQILISIYCLYLQDIVFLFGWVL